MGNLSGPSVEYRLRQLEEAVANLTRHGVTGHAMPVSPGVAEQMSAQLADKDEEIRQLQARLGEREQLLQPGDEVWQFTVRVPEPASGGIATAALREAGIGVLQALRLAGPG